MLLMVHIITDNKLESMKQSDLVVLCGYASHPENLLPGIIEFQRARGRSCSMSVWTIFPCHDAMVLANVLEFERGTGRDIEADWNVRKM
jgi:hypothetical protein